jgi:ribosomal protein S18 acetylase RimI-like enzyme
MIELQTVQNSAQIAKIKILFKEYAVARKDDPALVDFPEEIKSLPGEYAPPAGSIIIAFYDRKLAGCVALHKLDEKICEMKRLYVRPSFRKKGIGKFLIQGILNEAFDLGYIKMRLDSIPSMKTAQRLYESAGFYEIPDYRNNPNKGTKYFEIDLSKNHLSVVK